MAGPAVPSGSTINDGVISQNALALSSRAVSGASSGGNAKKSPNASSAAVAKIVCGHGIEP